MTAALLFLGLGVMPQADSARSFNHRKHEKVAATCVSCHVGAAMPERAIWPDPVSCAASHDGAIEPRVVWQPRDTAAHSNLRFDHGRHREAKPTPCVACHAAPADPWMTVQRAEAQRCVDCHGLRVAHLAAPDTACATCHRPLAEATSLVRAEIADFPEPPSHEAAAFAGKEGHGAAVDASCATCHAREFCIACHVDAPEQPRIQALASDPRSTAIRARLTSPTTHAASSFIARHGTAARSEPQTCITCHTRESCLSCHVGTPRVAAMLPSVREAGRGPGAVMTRRAPLTHTATFTDRHSASATVAPATCAGCHVRADCLDCHRPSAAAAGGYHATGFLERHPAAAYARETSCSDCHNVGGFCQACHASAGLTAQGPLRSGYHDTQRFFIAGHGQAARQSLETCVGCHVERDCLVCHSALGARRFNPHGPGFDANRLRRKNPEMCAACHGASIPTR